MMSDQILLCRIASGDTHAFVQFYDRHAPRLLGALMKWLGHRGDAEDVLQEIFLQVWCRASQYNASRSPAEVWLFVIARSRALDYLRRLPPGRLPSMTLEEVTRGDALCILESREAIQQVRKALAMLPEEQRSAITLAFYEGMTYDQVARLQAIPLGTAKTRIRTGMKRMRELLRDSAEVKSQ
jgi:RNA polymerase sigma-70 factor (ECF subfamily)